MSSSRDGFRLIAAAALALMSSAALAQAVLPGIGRPATPKEIAAWDIDVRPDFKGLPKGSGSVAMGQEVWEGKCAHCHGVFGESNEVFSPLVGGTTAEDVKTGRVARLTDTSYPGRTTLMKVSTVSTLWDYINRAMPWTQPKSLKADEVYAVTAYLLNLGGVLPDNYVMSDQNIAEVQARMPNRNGMTLDHGMWPGKSLKTAGKPDVKAVACMTNCEAEPKVASFLPDFARNAHGNLAEQNRLVGAQRGADTTRPAGVAVAAAAVAATAAPAKAADSSAAVTALLSKYSCTACHGMDNKLVGPSFREIAKKYGAQADGAAYLAGKIKAGGSGVWGQIPMPPQTLSDTEARMIGQWLTDGAKK
ncbi:c-type cytochrome [Sphaerotilus sp.]|uniref:c-type cytochrome n=1 Tax=Sphaerotilus sp. TaxID=2093942 RepID=UPI002ACD5CBE|nr:c-type cytochrome [Sphaerotilus sp.]MDZ7854892.1 c-type cytochrome [Sphaerotilus sp.]